LITRLSNNDQSVDELQHSYFQDVGDDMRRDKDAYNISLTPPKSISSVKDEEKVDDVESPCALFIINGWPSCSPHCNKNLSETEIETVTCSDSSSLETNQDYLLQEEPDIVHQQYLNGVVWLPEEISDSISNNNFNRKQTHDYVVEPDILHQQYRNCVVWLP